jgi:hypothetical protein
MPKAAKQVLWMIAIWAMSVSVLGFVATIIRYWIK